MMKSISNKIKTIVVSGLFGIYDYSITANEGESNFTILYGDNGCGKTTILELLYHLLTPEIGQGHLTFISRVPFKTFRAEFENGTRISAVRSISEPGHFSVEYPNESGSSAILECVVNDEGAINNASEPLYTDYKAALTKLSLGIHLLSSERKLETHKKKTEEHEVQVNRYGRIVTKVRSDSLSRLLRIAFSEVRDWARREALTAGDLSSISSNAVYLNLIHQLGKKSSHSSPSFEINALANQIESISAKSEPYIRLGLIPDWDPEPFLKAMKAVRPENYFAFSKVFGTYVDGIEAKLEALENLQSVLTSIVEALNTKFFTDKTVSFNLEKGFRISNKMNKSLRPEHLSSGEKHLLLLLCNTLSARLLNKSNVFIIDEPEISLNVKWQRSLLQTLSACTLGSQSQFLIATHSIEVLSDYSDSVFRLGGENVHGR